MKNIYKKSSSSPQATIASSDMYVSSDEGTLSDGRKCRRSNHAWYRHQQIQPREKSIFSSMQEPMKKDEMQLLEKSMEQIRKKEGNLREKVGELKMQLKS